MQDSTSENLDYCKNLIKTHDYARYLQCAFYPAAIPYYALDAELKHIHDHVREEMIGHIRYAWWAEAIDALPAVREHPVIKSLSQSGIDKAVLMKLVDAYREAWPNLPEHPPELAIDDKRWSKAEEIIAEYQRKPRWMMVIRLLFV